MKIEVEVISTETIKPSSPTPNHLYNYQLSFLDQISPPVYMPMILFFADSDHTDNKLNKSHKADRLKTSLSETLARFYPLAGRLIDNFSIACSDEGVPYSEAKVKCELSEVVKDPVPGEFNKFLPRGLDEVDDTLLAIQVSFFQCGGIAVGICISHKVADALSLVMFITSWAATAREDGDVLSPTFDSVKLFPPRNLSGFKPSTGIIKEKIATKRFVFSNSMVAALRLKYTEDSDEDCPIRPTRVEALSTFIWSRFAAATRADSVPEKLYTVIHAVNLRTRMDPPLPEHSFGNLYRIAIATPSMEAGNEGRGLVKQMRGTIKSIDGNYVTKSLREGLPLYEVDFGWGKPVRIGSAKLTFRNLVTFMDTRSGDGIEAWINLHEEDMAKFEADKELLACVSQACGY
ncbi:hypothetical protein F0562_034186 [Nyssa sinensis]|uniref:Uncharacterized protein n=1 Tax=Nyssa sinensis TaxID=561372 RepID=A0A5J5AHK8_9ASTE|nr:hypothetical protein F0562_034186 [Nyssa sinensis]